MVLISLRKKNYIKDFEIDPNHFKTLRQKVWLMHQLSKVIWRALFDEN